MSDRSQPGPKTRAMTDALRRETSPTALISQLSQHSLQGYLILMMGRRGVSTDALAELAGLNRASLYKILNGATKHPQRNVLLRLALVLRLSFDETQELLYLGRHATLSGSRARDIILSHGIIKKLSIDEVNERLLSHQLTDLYAKE